LQLFFTGRKQRDKSLRSRPGRIPGTSPEEDTLDRRRFITLASLPLLPAIGAADPTWRDETWEDPARRRSVPVRIRWPAGEGACALVLFSHGLGGNLGAGTVWADAWQAAGFAVLNLQHPGSDTDVLRSGGLRAVRQAAQPEQYLARVADARFVLDDLERRRNEGPWRRIRPDAIGFSGHSFGARLTQALAGESMPQRRGDAAGPLADPRPRAFIAFSPGFNSRGGTGPDVAERRFGAITRPFLCVTGTLDDDVIAGDATYEARRAVYRGLPAGAKAELVLEGADHMTFGGQSLAVRPRRGPLARAPGAAEREAEHRATVVALTTDWWRWRLLGDTAARQRLQAPAGLAAGDVWQQA
jgi:hypothetical protein